VVLQDCRWGRRQFSRVQLGIIAVNQISSPQHAGLSRSPPLVRLLFRTVCVRVGFEELCSFPGTSPLRTGKYGDGVISPPFAEIALPCESPTLTAPVFPILATKQSPSETGDVATFHLVVAAAHLSNTSSGGSVGQGPIQLCFASPSRRPLPRSSGFVAF